MWFGPVNEGTYVYVVCRSTSTMIAKEPMVSGEPTTVTGTTRDRPGTTVTIEAEGVLPSSESWVSLFISERDLPYKVSRNVGKATISPLDFIDITQLSCLIRLGHYHRFSRQSLRQQATSW